METEQLIHKFFDDYAGRANGALGKKPVVDIDEAAGQFADYFVEASPVGVSGGANDDAFRTAIPRGYEFYREIGTQSMSIVSRDVTPLDEFHWMVKIHWKAEYLTRTERRETIEFDVIYFVQVRDGKPKIFAYITGDEQRVLRERGLINPDHVSETVLG